MTQLFDLNARIQQLMWSLIFYEKYSTSLSAVVLVVLTTANFGWFSNFCRYYTRSQAGKSTGYRPTLKPLHISLFWHIYIYILEREKYVVIHSSLTKKNVYKYREWTSDQCGKLTLFGEYFYPSTSHSGELVCLGERQ